MTLHHFFVRKENIKFPLVSLSGEEHHHLSRVLRLKKGEEVRVFDEDGELYAAVVARITPHQTILQLGQRVEVERSSVNITVAQACLKTKMMDLLVQKMTELRVARFIPLVTSRTVVRFEGQGQSKVARWRRLALEAAKQCQSSLVPEITLPLPLSDFLSSRPEPKKLYLSERGGVLLREVLLADLTSHPLRKPDAAVVCVGPEGGWEEREEELLQKHGFQAISLGAKIFRSETALLSVASILCHFWNA